MRVIAVTAKGGAMMSCKDCENYELCLKAGNVYWMNIEQTNKNHCGCYKEKVRKNESRIN